MYHKILADGFFIFSIIAIFLAMVGFLVEDIVLASTQWMLISIFFMGLAIFVKLCKDDDEEILKVNNKTTRGRGKK